MSLTGSGNKILVTGTAGFIGYHLAERLINQGYEVVGLDVINDYYDQNLKFSRLENHGILARDLALRQIAKSGKYENYRFLRADLADTDFLISFMKDEKFDFVVNLAAQAGVRYSMENPTAYTHSNVSGFLSILEGSRHSNVKHLIYASTSSVYGLNTNMPLSESQNTDHPMALYAATKKANELMAHSYSHLFGLPTSGLRFFTVYGPWGRPDMALFLFTKAILSNEPIKVFNHGAMIRDFTYVNDIVESISRLVVRPPVASDEWNSEEPRPDISSCPYRIFNIGNSAPVKLMEYIEALERQLGKEAIKSYLPMQPGDVPATHANTHALENWIGFKPATTVDEGIKDFVSWYLEYHK